MNKILQRYLATNFIPPFILSTSFFIIFLLTFELFRLIRIVINKGVEFSTVLELTANIAMTFVPMAIPLSTLFSAIYTLNRMSEDSEIIAMRSFGMRKFQMFVPFLFLGIFIALGVYSAGKSLIPYAKTEFKNTVVKLTSKGMLTDIKAEQFFTEVPNVTLFVEKVSGEGNQFENVFIHHQDKEEGSERVILAKRGALVKQVLGELQTPMVRMHLTDGNITKSFDQNQDVQKILFKEYDFPLVTGGYKPAFVTKDSMRTNAELVKVISQYQKRKANLEKKQTAGKELSEEEVDLLERLKDRLPRSQIEYWSRINTPIQCFVFILLGFALGIKKGRGRSRNSAAMGLLILIGYYVLFFLGISWSQKGQFSPELAVFLPTALAALIGAKLYLKLDWVG